MLLFSYFQIGDHVGAGALYGHVDVEENAQSDGIVQSAVSSPCDDGGIDLGNDSLGHLDAFDSTDQNDAEKENTNISRDSSEPVSSNHLEGIYCIYLRIKFYRILNFSVS